jgi:Lon protease-like protein
VRQELDIKTPYRQIDAQWDEFADDLHPPELDHDIDRRHLTDSLRRYIAANGFSADWSAVEEAPAEALVNALSTLCPFEPEEKQALLEAPDVHARCGALITLFEIDATPDAGGSTSLQ